MGHNSYKFRVGGGYGTIMVVPPENSDMQFVHMEYLRLKKGGAAETGSANRETGVLLMGGDFTVKYDGKSVSIKGRPDSFSGLPHCVYIPAGKSVVIRADTDFEAAVYGVPAEQKGTVGFVYPDDIKILEIGENEWYINGYYIIDENFPAQKLVIGETQIPAGHWGAVPPHTFEKEVPGKGSGFEEIYLFKFKPEQGFGFQGLYTDNRDLDDAFIIRTNDVILVPRGYHPNAAGPGYQMRMFWGVGGKARTWPAWEDPDHKWIAKKG